MPVKRKGPGLSLAKLENAQKRGLILVAKLIAQRATNLAPVDTGRLKRSITHSQPKQLGKGHFTIEIGTNVEYAIYQEFGTGDKSIRPEFSKDSGRPGIAPRPYLTPAIKNSKRDVVKIITKNVVAALKQ